MLIKFLLWLLLGRKLAEPLLTIAPRRTRRYQNTMLRRALNIEPGVRGLPELPVRPARGAPPHKNEAAPAQRPIQGPCGSLTAWYGRPIVAGTYPGEDDDAACGNPEALTLMRSHYDDPYGVHGRASERDY